MACENASASLSVVLSCFPLRRRLRQAVQRCADRANAARRPCASFPAGACPCRNTRTSWHYLNRKRGQWAVWLAVRSDAAAPGRLPPKQHCRRLAAKAHRFGAVCGAGDLTNAVSELRVELAQVQTVECRRLSISSTNNAHDNVILHGRDLPPAPPLALLVGKMRSRFTNS